MNHRRALIICAVFAAGCASLLVACGGSSSPPAATAGRSTTATSSPSPSTYAPSITPALFTDRVTNRYFPLTPGTTYSYEGTKEGEPERNEVTVTRESKTILGVRCVVVHDVVTANGVVVEDTLDWYAQDNVGNVWYFGEAANNYEGGKLVDTKGSWEAGVDGAKPGIVMKAAPKPGDEYRQEYYRGEAEDMARVIRVDDTVTVTAGSYRDVVVTEDFTALDPDVLEKKYFAPGIGFVKGGKVKGGAEQIQLVKITTN